MSAVDTGEVEVVDLTTDEEAAATPARRERRPVSVLGVVGIIAVVAIVAATVVGGLLTRREAVAATVDGHDITQHALDRELGAFTHNKQLPPNASAQIFSTPGHVSTQFTASRLEGLVLDVIVHDEFVRRKLSIDPGQLANRVRVVKQRNPGYPDWFIETFVRRSLEDEAIVGGDRTGAPLLALVQRAHVTIDPRYGTYDPTVRTNRLIIPPAAPKVRFERSGSPPDTSPNPLGG